MTNATISNELNIEDRHALAFLKIIGNKSKYADFHFRSFDDVVLSDGKKRSDKTLAKNHEFGLKACITELREANSNGAVRRDLHRSPLRLLGQSDVTFPITSS